jgi:hypothetical protein
LCRHRRNNLLAVGRTLLPEDFPAQAVADGPVELHHAGIHRLGNVAATGVDQAAQVGEQRRGIRRARGVNQLARLRAFLAHGESLYHIPEQGRKPQPGRGRKWKKSWCPAAVSSHDG